MLSLENTYDDGEVRVAGEQRSSGAYRKHGVFLEPKLTGRR
jgi:hypothetical protein